VGVVITQIGPKAWVAMDENERSLNANSPKANPFKSPQIISPSVIHPRRPPIQILFNSSILKDLAFIQPKGKQTTSRYSHNGKRLQNVIEMRVETETKNEP